MSWKNFLKKYYPYVGIIALFIAVSYVYFLPVIGGQSLKQMDVTHAKGMAKEIKDFEKETGEESLWTNSMFGGMPTYHIGGGKETKNIFRDIDKWVRLKLPYHTVGIMFLYFLGFFILLLSMRMNKWLALLGALAFGLASYKIIIIGAGHMTKAYAIAFMAPVVAGEILTYRKHYLGGGLLTLLGLGLEIGATHVQVTYYLAYLVLIIAIGEFINDIKRKRLAHFFKASLILVVAALLAVATDTSKLWKTYEYGNYSIRGEKELSTDKTSETDDSGLDRDYALAWSYGVKETLTFMIPNAVGGASGKMVQNDDAMQEVDRQFKNAIARQNQYWGSQPFTSGPVYFGAIIVFLFILGLFYLRGPLKWSLLAATLLSIMLAWGKNFGVFTDLFFYNVPFYNKFRTVSMILIICGITMPLMAFLTLQKIIKTPNLIKQNKRGFFIAFGLTGGLSLLFGLFPSLFFDFLSPREISAFAQQKAQNPNMAGRYDAFMENLEAARQVIFTKDAFRSFGFIAAASLIIWLFTVNKKVKKVHLLTIVGVLIIIDLWSVDKRYVNNDQFSKKSTTEKQFQKTKADRFILKDSDHPNFRVLNITTDPFKEVHTSYFHQSIGGYHGAKMRRYQNLIDFYLSDNTNKLRNTINKEEDSGNVHDALAQMPVLNMLNTRYVIYNKQKRPVFNPNSLGTAWFVEDYTLVKSPDEEINSLNNFDPEQTAIINNTFKSHLDDFNTTQDSIERSMIKRIRYEPNHRIYQVNTDEEELAVFSEIYYPKGWQAYLDDEPVDHFRANYVLRAMILPEGQHKLEFKFEPKADVIGQNISLAASILASILLIGGLIWLILLKNREQKSTG